MKPFTKLFFASLLVLSVGCSKDQSSIEDSSQKAAEAIGCDSFKSKAYDSMYEYLDHEQAAPDLATFTSILNEKIDAIAIAQKIDNPEAIDALKNNISDLYKLLIEKSAELKQTKTAKEHLQTLIEMEMEDQSTPENVQLNQKAASQFAKIDSSVKELDVQCGETGDGGTGGSTPAISQKNVITGSHNVLATAYQSCQALEIPEISRATPDVVGIERYGTHEDGVGGQRRVASLSDIQETHPYIKVAGGAQAGCFNVRNNPLIYDYGGQAYISNNIIDFSKNSGSGTSALGIDCSAYVSAAVAAGGLRYKPGLENKAIYIRQNSSKFINAKNSGFTCFNNATMTPTTSLQPGDIVGVNGHVVIVDTVGADPFGLKRLSSANDCSSLSTTYFDFTVSQSSPSKGGIGLNKYIAKDYLRESTKMTAAFMGFAKAACQAYFTGKNVATPSSDYGVLRHNGAADCLSPRIQMAYQSCVSQCLQ